MKLTDALRTPCSLLLLAVACGAGPAASSVQSRTPTSASAPSASAQSTTTQGNAVTVTDDLHVTLLGVVPFTDTFADRTSTIGLGLGPARPVRLTPLVRLDPSGQPWLLHGKVALRLRGDPVDLSAVGGSIVSFQPLQEGGVVVLSRRGADDVVARVDGAGQVVWSSDRLMSTRVGDLLQDAGKVWASGAPKSGPVVAIDAQTGQPGREIHLGGYRGSVLAGQGAHWRIEAEGGVRRWVREPAASSSPAPASLQPTSARALGPLPDGGVVVVDGTRVSWARADGSESGLRWRGVARSGDGIVWAEGDEVVRMHDADAVVEVRGLPAQARLIAERDGKRVFVAGDDAAFGVDASGQVESLPAISAQARMDLEARVDLATGVVSPTGDVVLAGVDPSGAFVLSLER